MPLSTPHPPNCKMCEMRANANKRVFGSACFIFLLLSNKVTGKYVSRNIFVVSSDCYVLSSLECVQASLRHLNSFLFWKIFLLDFFFHHSFKSNRWAIKRDKKILSLIHLHFIAAMLKYCVMQYSLGAQSSSNNKRLTVSLK